MSFDLAKSVFQDMGAVEWFDDRRDYGEERFVIIGIATNATLLVVSYTERAENIRIILREERHLMKKTNISAKISEDVTALSSEAIERAARLDPDALPLTAADFGRMKRTPRTRIMRRALELTQEQFAARYHIPLGTLRDWEQGRAEPDQPTRAYLKVIARDPEHVRRLLDPRTNA